MKKKGFILICVSLLVLALVYFFPEPGGNVRNVIRHIGNSTMYSEAEISQVMDMAIDHFDREFDGCTMTQISYEEDFSNSRGESWLRSTGAEQVLVLSSSFLVDSHGGDGSFNPNSLYTQWQWVFIREKESNWQFLTCGYG